MVIHQPFVRRFILGAFLAFSLLSNEARANSGITYHGKILRSDDTPVNSTATQFRIQIRTPGIENCLLWEEYQTKDLFASNGVFIITISDTTEPSLIANTFPYTLERVFSNRTNFTGLTGCSSGSTFNPSSSAQGRILQVAFREDGVMPWESMPIIKVNLVPLAINSVQLEGYSANEFLKIDPTSSYTSLTATQVNTLLDLIAGTDTQYLNPSSSFSGDVTGNSGATVVERIRGTNVVATAPTSGQVLKFDGTNWAPAADGGTTTDASYVAKGVVQINTDQATSGLYIASGVLALPNVITASASATGDASTIPVLQWDQKGRLTSVTTVTVDDTAKLTNTAYAADLAPVADTTCTGSEKPFWSTVSGTWDCAAITGFVATTTGFAQNGNSFGAPAVLGTNEAQPLHFETDSTTKMTILANGNVGIGDTNPAETFTIEKASGANQFHQRSLNGAVTHTMEAVGSSTGIISLVAGTGWTVPSNYSTALDFAASGYDGVAFQSAANITFQFGEVGVNDMPADIIFRTTADGTTTGVERMRINSEGRVGIGTSNPDVNSKLEVAGLVKITGGTPGVGKVLTSDATGLATWTTLGGSESTTVSNVGAAGVSPYKQMNGSAIELHSINAGTSSPVTVTLDAANNEIDLGVNAELQGLSGLSANGFVKRTAAGTYTGISAIDMTTDITGILPVANGGTGANTLGSGNLLVGAGTSAVTSLAAGTAGNVVYATGVATWTSATPDTAGLVDKSSTQSITGTKIFGNTLKMSSQNLLTLGDTGANGVSLRAPATVTSNYTLTFPAAQGGASTILQNDGSGNLSWVAGGNAASNFIQNGNSFGAAATLGTNEAQPLHFETDSTTKMTILADGNVGIGMLSPSASLHVLNDSTTASAGIVLERENNTTVSNLISFWPDGVNSATNVTWSIGVDTNSNHFQFKTWDGTTGAYPLTILADGKVGIGTTGPSTLLEIASDDKGLKVSTNPYTATGLSYANEFLNVYNAATVNTDQISGIYNRTLFSDARATNYAYGLQNELEYTATGNATELVGSNDFVVVGAASGTVSRAKAGNFSVNNSSAGTLTDAYGVYSIVEKTGAGTLTNAYGVYVDTLAGTNRWGIYQAGVNDTNHFAGSVGIGTPTDHQLGVMRDDERLAEFVSTGPNNAFIRVDNFGGGNQSAIWFNDLGTGYFQVGKQFDNTFFMWDQVANRNFLTSQSGELSLQPEGGDVGVGTLSPDAIFHVQYDSGPHMTLTSGGIKSKSTGIYGAVVTLESQDTGGRSYSLVSSGSGNYQGAGYFGIFDNTVNDPSSYRFMIAPNGNVGIGTGASAPSAKLQVEGSVLVSSGANTCTISPTGGGGTTGITCSSDARLKENIATLPDALNKVLQVRGVTYTWKDRSIASATNIGFIAQEMEKVTPELVVTSPNGMKAVNYANFVAVLTNAIREFYQIWSQDSRELRSEIEKVKAENLQLKRIICKDHPEEEICEN